MTNAIQCDTCGTVTPADSEESDEWLHVTFGIGRGVRGDGDYCTAACAVQGIEAERDRNATLLLAAMEEDV